VGGSATIRIGEVGGTLYEGIDYLWIDGASVSVDRRAATLTITGGGGGVPSSRTISTSAPLAGGGDLSTDRTLSLSYGSGLALSGSSLIVDTSTIATRAFATAEAAAAYVAAVAASQPLDAGLTSLTSADATAGLPYVTAANAWETATLGDLYVSSGAWRVTGLANLPTAGQKAALAGSSGTPDSTNPYVTSADPRLTGASGGAAVAAAAEYGTGANGTLNLDGVNTYASLVTLAGSTYTINSGVVLNALNLTVASGITLKTAGSPVRVLNTLTLNGTIDASGSAAADRIAGAGASPAAAPSLPAGGNVFVGGSVGVNGMTGASAGTSNTTYVASSLCSGGQGGAGGRGVYTVTVRAGGTTTLANTAVLTEHFHGEMQALLQLGRADGGGSRLYLGGGAGGAAGGNSTGSGSGTLYSGGGGGGGGIAAVFARVAVIGASAQILADGGAGGNAPYTTPGNNAGSGGGGGGGGGVVFLKIGQVSGTQRLPALYARGGAGGNANYVGAGYGDGGNGGTGGKIYCIVANYTGSAPTAANTGGAGGAGAGTGGVSGTAGSTGALNVYNSL
jgi:hypothetical protein